MCGIIVLQNQQEISSLQDFKNYFKIQEPDFDWWDDENIHECCMCEIDLEKFFQKHFPDSFEYDWGDWYEK